MEPVSDEAKRKYGPHLTPIYLNGVDGRIAEEVVEIKAMEESQENVFPPLPPTVFACANGSCG